MGKVGTMNSVRARYHSVAAVSGLQHASLCSVTTNAQAGHQQKRERDSCKPKHKYQPEVPGWRTSVSKVLMRLATEVKASLSWASSPDARAKNELCRLVEWTGDRGHGVDISLAAALFKPSIPLKVWYLQCAKTIASGFHTWPCSVRYMPRWIGLGLSGSLSMRSCQILHICAAWTSEHTPPLHVKYPKTLNYYAGSTAKAVPGHSRGCSV